MTFSIDRFALATARLGAYDLTARDSLLGIHRALFPRNVTLDYVHSQRLSTGKLRQYKLVISPTRS